MKRFKYLRVAANAPSQHVAAGREYPARLAKKYGRAAQQVQRERGGNTPEVELKRLLREATQLKQELFGWRKGDGGRAADWLQTQERRCPR